MAVRQTTQQQRAQFAWDAVNEVGTNQQGRYATLARKLSAMIQVNGLASTLAFLFSKSKDGKGDQVIARHLSDWVTGQLGYTQGDLMHLIQQADTDLYRRATAEAIEYSIWLSRYVSGLDWERDDN